MLTLLRLGRTSEARAALESFARGDHGALQADAQRLLGDSTRWQRRGRSLAARA